MRKFEYGPGIWPVANGIATGQRTLFGSCRKSVNLGGHSDIAVVSCPAPTKTGLEKAIPAIRGSFRDYLRLLGFHDFAQRSKRDGGRRVVSGFYVAAKRPEIKNDNPEIWIYGLKAIVASENSIAFPI